MRKKAPKKMPKTTKKFDWEIYDQEEEFIDILSMTRDEMKQYKDSHKDYTVKEIGYTSDDGGDDSWETDSKKDRDIYRIRIPKRRRDISDVY